MYPFRGMINSALQCPLEMREALRRTPKAHGLADVVAALFTTVTSITGYTDFESHSITGLDVRYRRPYCCDDTGRLVAKC